MRRVGTWKEDMPAFCSVVSVVVRGLMPPISGKGRGDGCWVGEVVVDLAGDVAL
jgi:hypothetical protein